MIRDLSFLFPQPSPFNQVRLAWFRSKVPVLMAVDDAGQLVLWNLQLAQSENTSSAVISKLLHIEQSAWALAFHEQECLVAVGSNDHKIYVWDVRQWISGDSVDWESIEQSRVELIGHQHNVPAIGIDIFMITQEVHLLNAFVSFRILPGW